MPRTPFCDRFGLEHPIVNAPMAGTATAALAAAVSNAGGFGLIGGSDAGGSPEHPEWLRAQIRAVRELTDRPFGVGFILSYPLVDELTEVALSERVAVAYSFGNAAPFLSRAQAAGVRTLVQVQTLAQATAAVAAGADVVVAQGAEGGGHVGSNGTFSFVPAVVDAVGGKVPVLAAGGIADGRGLAAALMLGAAGVWMGTRFLASIEWAGGEWRKRAVAAADVDGTVRTRAYDLAYGLEYPEGIAGRVIRNGFTDAWHGRPDAEIVAAREDLRATREAAEEAEDPNGAPVWAGSTVGLIDGIEPAGAIVRRVAAEADRLLAERCRELGG